MESVFVQKIFLLTEEILANKRDLAEIYKELEVHLARARRLKMQLYEVEALNTLGIYYLFDNKVELALNHFQMAWAIAQHMDNTDVKLKLINNLSETNLLQLWRVDDAYTTLMPAIELIRKEKIETLVTLYVFSNSIRAIILRGEYTAADTLFEEAWQIASRVEMLGYSKIEYAQVIIDLHGEKILIDIAKSQYELAKDRLGLLRPLLNMYKRQDFEELYGMMTAIHKLMSENNEAGLDGFMKSLEQGEVVLNIPNNLNMAIFMKHNNQPDWAKRLAQRVLDKAKAEENLPSKLVETAQQILNPSLAKDTQ